jgi:ubiquinone/menaquinone biosynthesis C-methylase UbiE
MPPRAGSISPSIAQASTGFPMADYREKSEYYSDTGVASYDRKRFQSLEGRIKDRNDWRALKRALDRVEDKSLVLDLPSGTGRFFPELAAQGFPMIAADLSPQMLRYSRERYPEASRRFMFGRFDLERLPFRDKTIPCTIVFRFFHLVTDERICIEILQELNRVTSGWVIATFHHRYTFKYLSDRLRGRRPKAKLRFRDLRRMVAASGLHLEQIIPTGYPFSSNWVVLLRAQPVT